MSDGRPSSQGVCPSLQLTNSQSYLSPSFSTCLYICCIISVCSLFLPVSTFVAWVSTCISWLKESSWCCVQYHNCLSPVSAWSLHLLHHSYLDLLAKGVRLLSVLRYHIFFFPVSTLNLLPGFCLDLLTEGVGLLSMVSITSVFLMSLPVTSSLARISWLKESGCCLW